MMLAGRVTGAELGPPSPSIPAPYFGAVIMGAGGGVGRAISDRLKLDPDVREIVELSRSVERLDVLSEEASQTTQSPLDRPLHLIICATGILTTGGPPPERMLRQLDQKSCSRSSRECEVRATAECGGGVEIWYRRG